MKSVTYQQMIEAIAKSIADGYIETSMELDPGLQAMFTKQELATAIESGCLLGNHIASYNGDLDDIVGLLVESWGTSA